MNRRTVEIVVIAGILVLVISVAASTLDSTVSSGGGGGMGGDNGSGILPPPEVNESGGVGDVNVPREPLLALAVIGGLLAIWYLASNPKKTIALVVGAAVIFGLLFLVLYAIQDLFGQMAGGGRGGGFFGGGDGSPGLGQATGVADPRSIELLAVLVLGAVLVGIVLRATDTNEIAPMEESESTADDVDVDAIARTAGRAADRIEGDAAVDNEVYRAWQEMTDLLDVPDPETSTAGEFADAAVEAGMDREDVEELTVLFEEVRYGARDPTTDREERAIAALRRIEAYADEEQ